MISYLFDFFNASFLLPYDSDDAGLDYSMPFNFFGNDGGENGTSLIYHYWVTVVGCYVCEALYIVFAYSYK